MLILASTSIYRAQLLARLRLPFESVPPAVSETPLADETPQQCASRLAIAKARAVADSRPAACVIGSDQVADCDGALLGKPGTTERAIAQLLAFSGRSVLFHTAVCVVRADRQQRDAVDTTRVEFREIDADTARRYVEAELPLDCAGSFRCEGLGISLFERIASEDPTALVGLPLIRTAGLLRWAGYRLP